MTIREVSKLSQQWWDFTTIDQSIINDAAKLTLKDIEQLARPGFEVHFYDSREELFMAQALQYINDWKAATADNPSGICGPIGPTEHLPLVARLINELNVDLSNSHFWGMDEWVEDGKVVGENHPLSFAGANLRLWYNLIRPELRMPKENLHFATDDLDTFSQSFSDFRCMTVQGGQGDIMHWAFNDPLKREGKFADAPPTVDEYLQLGARHVELHPMSCIQNSQAMTGGNIFTVPDKAVTLGPKETWQAEKVSIWHPGYHASPFGQRLTALMISKGIADSCVPMSLLGKHRRVQFHFYRGGLGSCTPEIGYPLPLK